MTDITTEVQPLPGLVGPTGIAAMAGVQPGAVSNWRRRDSSFPAPVGGNVGRPLFLYDEVEHWLHSHGKRCEDRRLAQTVWTLSLWLRASRHPDDGVEPTIALLCLARARRVFGLDGEWEALIADCRTTGRADIPAYLRMVEAADTGSHGPHLDYVTGGFHELYESMSPDRLAVALVTVDTIPVSRMAELCDDLLSRVARDAARSGGGHGLPSSPISTLLAGLARTALRKTGGHRPTVYDPACGIGTSLLSLARDRCDLDAFAADVDRRACLVTQARSFLLFGADSRLVVRTADTLADDSFPDVRAEVVVAEPPSLPHSDGFTPFDSRWEFGQTRQPERCLAFLQDAIAHLRTGGTAFVTTSMTALSNHDIAPTRHELVARGCVRAIIALPAHLSPNTSSPVAVWVLGRPNSQSGPIVVVDAAADAPAAGTPDLPEDLLPVADFAEHRVPWREVSPSDVLGRRDSPLTPALWLRGTSDGPFTFRDADALTARIRKATAWLTDDTCPLGALPDRIPRLADRPMVTLDRLVACGDATLWHGHAVTPHGSVPYPDVVTPAILRAGRASLDTPKTPPPNGPRPVSTPCDLLVTAGPRPTALIDHTGGHRANVRVGILRLRGGEWPPEYVAFLLQGDWNHGVTAVGDLAIPDASSDVRQRVAALLRARDCLKELTDNVERYLDRHREMSLHDVA